jgi:5-deoxy-D-glucuronate isomerase
MVSSVHEHHDYVHRAKFQQPVTLDSVLRDWEPRGFVFASPAVAFPEQRLLCSSGQTEVLLVVVEGRVKAKIGGQGPRDEGPTIIALETGDELYVPPGVAFDAHAAGDVQATVFCGEA